MHLLILTRLVLTGRQREPRAAKSLRRQMIMNFWFQEEVAAFVEIQQSALSAESRVEQFSGAQLPPVRRRDESLSRSQSNRRF